MNKHLQQRIAGLLSGHQTVTLATCGAAGPQISIVPYNVQHLDLYLLIPHGADHLFNLEDQPELVLLTPTWRLHGTGQIIAQTRIAQTDKWQTRVAVQPYRLHILGEYGHSSIETIDF